MGHYQVKDKTEGAAGLVRRARGDSKVELDDSREIPDGCGSGVGWGGGGGRGSDNPGLLSGPQQTD